MCPTSRQKLLLQRSRRTLRSAFADRTRVVHSLSIGCSARGKAFWVIEIRIYSTHYGKFASETPDYAAWYKAHDRQARLSDAEFMAWGEFTIELTDFRQRFGLW
jgi:hypothetical protein